MPFLGHKISLQALSYDVCFSCKSAEFSDKLLDWLKMKFPNGRFEILSEKEPWTREGPPVCTWRISTDDIYRIVVFLNPIVLNAIQSGGGSTSPVKKYFTSMAHTYGIFANAESESTNQYLLKLARERNWPAGVALTGSHKVLLCTDALKRYKSALLDLGLNEQQADQTAAWFVIAILVHEHFHAIAATGLDKQGRTSWAVNNWNEWQLGNVLNESLAAWMEWHFFRNNDTMVSNITDYIHSGQYPDWPYRGADKIEEIYKSQGLPGVREWIWRLREDPQHAQESFDQVA